MPELAREAIATKPDVVVAVSNVAILAVKEASSFSVFGRRILQDRTHPAAPRILGKIDA
jgi:hypothetical protein